MTPVHADDVEAIRRLKVQYAIATDAIASGDKEAGRSRYRELFLPDAKVAAGFDRSAPDVVAAGPDAWADACEASFGGFLGAHHVIGGVDVTFADGDADRASVTAYLHATMLTRETQDLTRVLGTYHDLVVRAEGGWRIAESFLQYFSIESGTRVLP